MAQQQQLVIWFETAGDLSMDDEFEELYALGNRIVDLDEVSRKFGVNFEIECEAN